MNKFELFFIFERGVWTVHWKDFACSDRCNVVGHCIEFHMFRNQFLQGGYQRKEQVIPLLHAFAYQVNFLKP